MNNFKSLMQVNTLNNVFPTQMQKGFYLIIKPITEIKISLNHRTKHRMSKNM